MTKFAAIILAAGKGTRMKSDLHKVLHPIGGKPMLMHLLDSFEELSPEHTVVVAGDRHEQLRDAVADRNVTVALQEPQLGTAHAALMAKDALAGFDGLVMVSFGDCPMVKSATVKNLCDAVSGDTKVAVLGFRPSDTLAYGRIIAEDDGTVRKMVEHKDASDEERQCDLCNSGVIVAHSSDIWRLLESVGNDNAQGEYYLPDVATNAIAEGDRVVAVETSPEEVAGINSREELADAERRWQLARRKYYLDAGVTLQAPDTVFFSWDTVLGRDVTVQPNVVFENHVRVGSRSRIEANLIVPAYSDIPEDTLVTRENLYGFVRNVIRSESWTGQFALSDRAEFVLRAGPSALSGLGQIIAQLDQRSHNGPPELLLDAEFEDILPRLKELQKRLGELIDEVERTGQTGVKFDKLGEFYRSHIAPWFKEHVKLAAKTANGMLSMSSPFLATYVTLSQLLDQAEFTAILSGLATATATAAQTVASRAKSTKERNDEN